MTPKSLKLGNHYRWRIGEPIPPRAFVFSGVHDTGPTRGNHWLVTPYKGRRWHHADTMQAMIKWRGTTYNLARLVISYTHYDGANPPFHLNTCGAQECVNPAHWMTPVHVSKTIQPVLEQRSVGFVVTQGGRWPTKDILVRVGKPNDTCVHLLRVLVRDYEQELVVVCGAPLDDQHLVVDRDATCRACIS